MGARINKALLFALKFLVSGGLLWLLFKNVGSARVAELLGNIPPLSILAASIIYLVAQLVSSFRWRLLLDDRFKIARLYSLYLVGSFFNIFLPGIVGGDAVKIYYLYKGTGKGTQALASVFMDRYTGFVALVSLGLLAYPVGFRHFGGSWLQWLLPIIAVVFISASALIFVMRLGSHRFKKLSKFYDYFHQYLGRREIFFKALGLSVIVQGLGMLAVYILSRGFGLDVPFLAYVVFIPIITTASSVPLSISGLGVREAAFVLLLSSMGVSQEAAMALSFSWFISMAAASLVGLIEYLRVKEHGKALPDITD